MKVVILIQMKASMKVWIV